MRRSDTKKAAQRPLIERTELDGGACVIAFADELYGDSPPQIVAVSPQMRVVVPPTISPTWEAWCGVGWPQMYVLVAEAADDPVVQEVYESLVRRSSGRRLEVVMDLKTAGADEEVLRYIRESAPPLDVLVTGYVLVVGRDTLVRQSQSVPKNHAETLETPQIVRQTVHTYFCRLVWDDRLYGDTPTKDVFVDDDLVLRVPATSPIAAWFGRSDIALWQGLNRECVPGGATYGLCVRALTDTGVTELRAEIGCILPDVRRRLRRTGAITPLTGSAQSDIMGYLTGHASPLETVLMLRECQRMTEHGEVIR